jgi:uncharacterized protein (TIGR00730 family)
MAQIRSVTVFCGAQPGHHPAYRASAEALGLGLARAGIRLVYGGGRIGLMGALADAALAGGGQVIGVIPEFLKRLEVANEFVQELIVTDSMHSRKRLMFDMADAFVALPGGLGTLDEIVEIVTWRQLKLHDKPVFLCDVEGSSEPVLAAFEGAITRGFAPPSIRSLYQVVDGVPAVLDALATAEAAGAGKAALT